MSKKILLINGPNLNLLGLREPSIYGATSLNDIENLAKQQAQELNCSVAVFQSNHEGAIVDRIQKAREEQVETIIINAGAFTHTSVAIRDALLGTAIRFIEIHITNIFAREAFRHHSYLSDKAEAVICGMGVYGYEVALLHAAKNIGPKASL